MGFLLVMQQSSSSSTICLGEESNIILLSLARNMKPADKLNSDAPQSSIGFLSILNRTCVALSRARIGLYIFGNAKILSRVCYGETSSNILKKLAVWEMELSYAAQDAQMYKLLLRGARIWENTVKDAMEAFAPRDARKGLSAGTLALESATMGAMKILSAGPDAWRRFNGVGTIAKRYAMRISTIASAFPAKRRMQSYDQCW